jgi:hypothetical protein
LTGQEVIFPWREVVGTRSLTGQESKDNAPKASLADEGKNSRERRISFCHDIEIIS